MIYDIVYKDFDASTKTHRVLVEEPQAGMFYATDIKPGIGNPADARTFGWGKTMDAAIHWKPVRAAINDLLGGRELISYTEAK